MFTIKEMLHKNRQEIVGAYQQGLSTCEIGRRLDVNGGYIYTFLKKDCKIKMREVPSIDKYKDEIIKLNSEGLSTYKIGKLLSLNNSTIQRYMIKLGLISNGEQRSRQDPLKNHSKEIINKYLAGSGCYLLAKEYKCSESSILQILHENDIEIRGARQYNFDEDYFKKIDSYEKAYILGFAYADGNNSKNAFRISVCDEEIINFIISKIGIVPIIELEPRGIGKSKQYSVNFSSVKMCNDLTSLGCMPNKTFLTTFPTFDLVTKGYIKPFLLGLLDGDGTITHCEDGTQWQAKYTGTIELMNGIKDFLVKELGITGSVYNPAGCDDRIGCYTIGGKNQLKIFLDWLYKDSKFCLLRKKNKYLEFCKLFN